MRCPNCKFEFSAKEAKIRSTPENKYYWGVIVDIISEETGYEKNEVHEILKQLFLREPRYLKTKEGLKEVLITKSTAELDVQSFEEYLSKIRQWASINLSIWIPEPNKEPL